MKQEATFDNQGCCRWIRLKYYHYSLWTGIYMLDKWERVLFNSFVLGVSAASIYYSQDTLVAIADFVKDRVVELSAGSTGSSS
eukprot:CAMPEP_0195527786 /NCGR_PEP_ID=MMETSP0794_2-20130614/29701_1 /TAXON_ID=515487 /ORGANISM="Stephanopyxis turris, Strain CCMP 815" /LENGTH=82 /DNA_ID=CAMNT_0040658781 /DNA_START=83 /DNA_END=331 /DNA_ORIENTATION=+